MTDAQRNQIDADAQIFIRTCSDAIKQVIIDGELHLFVIYMIWVYPLLFVKPSSASSSTPEMVKILCSGFSYQHFMLLSVQCNAIILSN